MSASESLRQGATVRHNTYRIERVLGQGGFGITYLAQDLNLERLVAIKEFFPKDYCNRDGSTGYVTLATKSNEDFVKLLKEKFLKEARNIAKFDNHGIIKIHAAFEENGTAYYVMDYIEGMPVSEMVKKNGPLSVEQASSYIQTVGDALSYLHSRKVNHLDVKPANIMVRRSDNMPILIDFGLSKQYDAQGNQTTATPVGLTHGFAPMEQYNQDGVGSFSPQSDLYSLAATYYYMMSGVVPPQATKLLDEELTFTGNIPMALIPVILKAMSPKRRDRHDTVDLFLNDVRIALGAQAAPVQHPDASTTIFGPQGGWGGNDGGYNPASNPSHPSQQNIFNPASNPSYPPQGGYNPASNPSYPPQGGYNPVSNPSYPQQGGYNPVSNPSNPPQDGYNPVSNPANAPQDGYNPVSNPSNPPQDGYNPEPESSEAVQPQKVETPSPHVERKKKKQRKKPAHEERQENQHITSSHYEPESSDVNDNGGGYDGGGNDGGIGYVGPYDNVSPLNDNIPLKNDPPKEGKGKIWLGVASGVVVCAIIVLSVIFVRKSGSSSGAEGEGQPSFAENMELVFFDGNKGKYTGPLDSLGRPEGRGDAVITTANGEVHYEGEFKAGKFEGEAVYTFSDGSKFEGTFANDHYSKGKYTDSEGNTFDGTFTDKGDPDKGTFRDASGNVLATQ